MQKFRFLLPLIVLTLVVVGISYGVRSYSNKPTGDNQQVETGTGDSSNQESMNSDTQEEKKGGILAFLFGGKKTTSKSAPNASPTPTPPPINVSFSTSEVEVPIDQERVVSIYLDANTEIPTAYTFNVRFDPKSINVVKLEPGDIWQQATIFTKGNKIDNTKGTLTYSAGQSLGTQKGTGKTLVKITLKAKSTAATGSELSIENTSKFAYVAANNSVYVVQLKESSVQIQVTK